MTPNIKNFFALFLTINMVFGITYAHADNTVTPAAIPVVAQDASPTVAAVKKGQPVPFDGTLLSPEAVATVVADRQASEETVKAETTRVQSEERAKCTFTVDEAKATSDARLTVSGANLEAEQKKEAALNFALKKEIASRPNVVFWSVLSAAAGAGAATLIVMAVGGKL
jgi:hypothetical protein